MPTKEAARVDLPQERKIAVPTTTQPPTTTLIDDMGALTHTLRESMHDHIQLVALEARLAVQSLTTMIAVAVGLGVLLVTTWLGLVGAAAAMLIDSGLAPPLAILVVAAMNLAVTPVLYRLIRRKARDLEFPATLRALRPVTREATSET